MSVTIREYRRGGWEVDIRIVMPDGRRFRQRKRAPVSSRSAAERWGEARERVLFQRLMNPPKTDAQPKEVPTLESFAPRFLDGHSRANRQKPSGIASKETILRVHLIPLLGSKKLDAIKSEDVQRLKSAMHAKAPKTVNNVLTVLNTLLKKAVEWDVIEQMPCAIKLLPVLKAGATFHDFNDYERLIEAALAIGWRTHAIVLLGGEAGLRCGEMVAMEWRDVDLSKRQLCVRQSDWKGQVTAPKNGRVRYVPLTDRLAMTLKEYRHLRSPRVLCKDDGTPLTRQGRGRTCGMRHVGRRCRPVFTFCVTRSARILRCVAHRREPFKSSRGTRSCR